MMRYFVSIYIIFIIIIFNHCALYSQNAYIGIYADDQHYYDSYCAFEGDIARIDMWIWCYPGSFGQICAEFRVTYPDNVIQSSVTPNNAIISVTLGELPEGISVCYTNCQWDWHWCYRQELWITNHETAIVDIDQHPDSGNYQFANCEPGYPLVPCTKLNNLYLNYQSDNGG